MQPTRLIRTARLANRLVRVDAQYDGVQRAEYIATRAGAEIGALHTAKWTPSVSAQRHGAEGVERAVFTVAEHGSKPRALTAARNWVAAGAVL